MEIFVCILVIVLVVLIMFVISFLTCMLYRELDEAYFCFCENKKKQKKNKRKRIRTKKRDNLIYLTKPQPPARIPRTRSGG